jgi:hypothetical protein
MKFRRTGINGQELRIDDFSYDATTGLAKIHANGSGASSGMELITFEDGKSNAYTTKAINLPSVSGGLSSLEAVLKSAPTGAMQASDGSWSYTLNLVDPSGILKPINVTDISVQDGQITNLGNLVTEYVNPANVSVAVTRDDNVDISGATIVFKYPGTPLDPNAITTDTLQLENFLVDGQINLNYVGINPDTEIINGHNYPEDDNILKPNKPFRNATTSVEINPRQQNTFLEIVPKLQNEQVTLNLYDYVNEETITDQGLIRVYDFATQIITSHTPINGKVTLDRMAAGTKLGINVSEVTDYNPISTIIKNTGEELGVFYINEVLTANDENREQELLMTPYDLPTGLPEQPFVTVTGEEFMQAYAGVGLQIVNGRVDIAVSNLNVSDDATEQDFSYFSERLGMPINRVYENKNPSRNEVESSYHPETNSFSSGDKIFTSSLSRGSPQTAYNYATINNVVMIYSANATSSRLIDNIFKELWRILGLNQTEYGDASSENGGRTINTKEGAVGRAMLKYYQAIGKDTYMQQTPEVIYVP